jgi:two-component system capsular synthesis sensor histidine kinase RcsC
MALAQPRVAFGAEIELQNANSLTDPVRILVVDDDPFLRELMAQLLSYSQYCVECADNGEVGWTALCATRFDLLITDCDMPVLDGFGLLRRVRSERPQLPVVLISGSMPTREVDFFRMLLPGIAIEKPFAIATLMDAVRTLLVSSRRLVKATAG